MALKIISSVIALISAFALITSVSSFSTPTFANNVVRYRSRSYRSKSSLEMGFGDAFKSAFSNDASLGKVQNAGLKNGPNNNDNVTMNGYVTAILLVFVLFALYGECEVTRNNVSKCTYMEITPNLCERIKTKIQKTSKSSRWSKSIDCCKCSKSENII